MTVAFISYLVTHVSKHWPHPFLLLSILIAFPPLHFLFYNIVIVLPCPFFPIVSCMSCHWVCLAILLECTNYWAYSSIWNWLTIFICLTNILPLTAAAHNFSWASVAFCFFKKGCFWQLSKSVLETSVVCGSPSASRQTPFLSITPPALTSPAKPKHNFYPVMPSPLVTNNCPLQHTACHLFNVRLSYCLTDYTLHQVLPLNFSFLGLHVSPHLGYNDTFSLCLVPSVRDPSTRSYLLMVFWIHPCMLGAHGNARGAQWTWIASNQIRRANICHNLWNFRPNMNQNARQ